jgi:Uma2 family endonuclease
MVMLKQRMTFEEFARFPREKYYELVRGELVERGTSPLCALIAGKIINKIMSYTDVNPIGIVYGGNCGYTLGSKDRETVRKPTASFVSVDRLPGGRSPNTCFEIAPDWAVLVQFPEDLAIDFDLKIAEYLDAGTKLVWAVRPMARRIMASTPDGNEISHGPNDTITAGGLLPGFSMKVGDAFPAEHEDYLISTTRPVRFDS